ncbi:GDSL-type esterase/lipase family protein [Rhizobium giardinii]|uniref:GDSL-type esterase/lipase family protein n=1 Tax=Rhizobium giardinii TaxID=56731 RepID=UPI0039DFFB72
MLKAVCCMVVLMLLGSEIALAADECDPIQTLVSTTPVIEQRPQRLKQAMRQREPQVPNPDLLLIGDSLIQKWQPYLRDDFPRRAVHNFGVGGDKTQEVLWRLKNLAPQISPREIIVLVGTNNLSDRSATPCGVSKGIQAVVDEVAHQWPQAFTFLVELLPRGEGFEFRSRDRRAVNDSLEKRYAGSQSVAFVRVDEKKLTCSGKSSQCSMFKPDLLHLEAEGYRTLRDALRQTSVSLFKRDRLQ